MALALVLTFSLPADANSNGVYVYNKYGSSVPMRDAPTSEFRVKVWMPNYTKFRMLCWTDKQWYTGNYRTNRWFYGQDYSRGSYGFVHASHVINQITVPRCK